MAASTGTDAVRSRAYCEQLTRTAARNFYYGLKLLPEPKRSAMFALYAYMRLVDDIADGEDGRPIPQRLDELNAWAEQTRAAYAGRVRDDAHPVWPAFSEMVRRYGIPAHLFEAVIAGQRQDLHPTIFPDFEQLRQYCYRVAGVVGLGSIYIWGFEGGDATEKLAIDRGIAFQLTNVLRDLREDAERGRSYIPQPEMQAAGITLDVLRGVAPGVGFEDFMNAQIARAESYYAKSAGLEEKLSRDARPTLIAMTRIYHGLLKKIAAKPARVLSQRVSLSPFSKLRIAWRATRDARAMRDVAIASDVAIAGDVETARGVTIAGDASFAGDGRARVE